MLGSTTRAGLAPRLFTPKNAAQPRIPDSYGFFGDLQALKGTWIGQFCRISGRVKAPRRLRQQFSMNSRRSEACPAISGGAFCPRYSSAEDLDARNATRFARRRRRPLR